MALDPSVVTPEHPELEHVVLGNGFQAHLLPAAVPKDRIQLYLEVKAGSVDEEEHEQGIAHYVEHVRPAPLFCSLYSGGYLGLRWS